MINKQENSVPTDKFIVVDRKKDFARISEMFPKAFRLDLYDRKYKWFGGSLDSIDFSDFVTSMKSKCSSGYLQVEWNVPESGENGNCLMLCVDGLIRSARLKMSGNDGELTGILAISETCRKVIVQRESLNINGSTFFLEADPEFYQSELDETLKFSELDLVHLITEIDEDEKVN